MKTDSVTGSYLAEQTRTGQTRAGQIKAVKMKSFKKVPYALTVALAWMLVGCTLSEVAIPDGISEVGSELPAGTTDVPTVRLPSVRLSSRPVVSIESLAADSADDTVAVEGSVIKRVGILDGWLYQIEDETGRVWVLSEGSAPEVDQKATVEGVVRYEAIVIGEIDAGDVYLEAKDYSTD